MRHVTNIATLLMATLLAVGCFKKEVQGTVMKIAVYSQNVSDDEVQHCSTELMAYAFYVDKGEKWKVESWEDALNMKITNADRPSQTRSNPDVIGTWNGDAEYQITLDLRAKYTSLVVVDVVNKVYAYRDYETPMNLAETPIQLHLYAWRPSGTATGWTTVNPFPDEQREPLDEPKEEQTDEQTGEQTGE